MGCSIIITAFSPALVYLVQEQQKVGVEMKRLFPIGWLTALAFFFTFVFSGTALAANQLQDMRIEVELLEDGSAVVTEYREMDMDEGTELYITLDNLQDADLLEFSVAGFEEEPNWDSNASREEKAGKYGVVETGSGLELIWGIGEYGDNSYEVTYTLSNLVRELEDGQSLYWNFDTFSSIPAENFTLQMVGPEPFTQEEVRFWGFGFEGDIQLVDGAVEWEAFEEIDQSNAVSVLLQFPADTFNTEVTVDQTLEEQRMEAQEQPVGGNNSNGEMGTLGKVLVGLAVATTVGGTAAGITYAVQLNNAKKEAGEIPDGAQLIVENEGITLSEVPYTGEDLPGIAYLMQNIFKGYFEDYFFAYLLKWESEERIVMHQGEYDPEYDEPAPGIIEIRHFAEESERNPQPFSELVQDMKKKKRLRYETGLWTMLLDAADETGMVTEDAMAAWTKDYAKDVEKFQNYLLDYSKDYLLKNGYIVLKEVQVWGRKHEVVSLTDKGMDLMTRLVQFDHYLEEVELVGLEKGTSQLSFADLLFWSVLFSRRDEITDQFDEMLDNNAHYDQHTYFGYYYYYWYGMTGFQDNWNKGLASGGFHSHNASMYTGSSGSSGSGGFTSVGGGGGAGGGGGGGAR